MAKKTSEKTTRKEISHVHFDVQGEWFTWMLRHLWVEGSHIKALRMWMSSFPHVSEPEHIAGIFLEVVSGKKGFTGWSSDEDGLTLREENRKHWDPNQLGEDIPNNPLLDSWEDVARIASAELLVAELAMLAIRRSAPYLDTVEEYYWERFDNAYLNARAIGAVLSENTRVATGKNRHFIDRVKQNSMNATLLRASVKEVTQYIDEMRDYFNTKYGPNCFVPKVDEGLLFRRRKRRGNHDEYDDLLDNNNESSEEDIPKKHHAPEIRESTFNPATGYDFPEKQEFLNRYISDSIRDVERQNITAEDIETTRYDSGYIDRSGNFYGCGMYGHIGFAPRLIEQFGLKPKSIDSVTDDIDGERIMEHNGWLKVSLRRYFWDYFITIPSPPQIETIRALMKTWQMEQAHFNETGMFGEPTITLEAALEENKADYNAERVMRISGEGSGVERPLPIAEPET